MIKTDDSSLDPVQLRAVEERARTLLDRADVWGRLPTPIDDILAAANLRVEKKSLINPAEFLAYLVGKAGDAAAKMMSVKSALAKVFGIYDPGASVIHIDDTVVGTKQAFLKLHETGHHELPVHKKLFRFFQDCEKTLAPEVADQFEREANNFARFALFQGTGFAKMAADYELSVKSPMALGKKFGASIYASAREFARTNHRACLVIVLNPVEYCHIAGARAPIRRVEASPSYRAKFSMPAGEYITLDEQLGRMLPTGGRRMVRPTQIIIKDRNGQTHECLADAFDTKHNIIVLLYPIKELTATTVMLPPGFKRTLTS